MSLENINSSIYLCYFGVISTHITCTKMTNYPGTESLGVAFKLRKTMKNSPSYADVLRKTLNVVILRCCFAEDGKEMYHNLKCTCRAIVFAHNTYCLAALPFPSSLLKFPNVTAFFNRPHDSPGK